MSAHIEAYLWSDGTSSPLFHQSITVQEPTGSPVTLVLPSPQPMRSALAYWQSRLNVSALSGSYGFEWDETTNRVRFDALGPASVSLTLGGNLAMLLGFSSGVLTGAASYIATDPPRAAVPLVGVDSEPPQVVADSELQQYRHGRGRAHFWTNHTAFRVGVICTEANAQAFLDGFCSSGRVRVFQSSSAAAWDKANLAGYIDGFVLGVADTVEEIGDPVQFIRLELMIAQEIAQ